MRAHTLVRLKYFKMLFRFKQRMSVISPNFDSIQSVLDTCKVCDSVVFLLSATQESEEWGETILSSVLGKIISTVLYSQLSCSLTVYFSLTQPRDCPLTQYFWWRIFPMFLKTKFRISKNSLPRASTKKYPLIR